MKEENSIHKQISEFNPDVEVYNQKRQDLLLCFDAGQDCITFNSFIKRDAGDTALAGDGATQLVWNIFYNENDEEVNRELVGYYTLAATSIPYIDRIRKEPDEMKDDNDIYDEKTCGISAVEIKMFAIDKKYQDLFYDYQGEVLPISAWILRKIIDSVEQMITESIGVKAIFLHAVPEAEEFYLKNEFTYLKENMNPLGSIDDDLTPMYMTLREITMSYDE